MTVIFKNEVPYIEGINLTTLVKQVPTPFYVYSQKSIEDYSKYFRRHHRNDDSESRAYHWRYPWL